MPARPPPRRRPRSRAALLSRPWHGRSPGACAFRRPLVTADNAGEPPQPVKVGGAKRIRGEPSTRWRPPGPPGPAAAMETGCGPACRRPVPGSGWRRPGGRTPTSAGEEFVHRADLGVVAGEGELGQVPRVLDGAQPGWPCPASPAPLCCPNRPGASRGCASQHARSLMSVMEVLAAVSWRNATACPKVSPVVWPAS